MEVREARDRDLPMDKKLRFEKNILWFSEILSEIDLVKISNKHVDTPRHKSETTLKY